MTARKPSDLCLTFEVKPLTSPKQAAWVRVVLGCAYGLGRGDHGNGPQAFPADGRRHLILALHAV